MGLERLVVGVKRSQKASRVHDEKDDLVRVPAGFDMAVIPLVILPKAHCGALPWTDRIRSKL